MSEKESKVVSAQELRKIADQSVIADPVISQVQQKLVDAAHDGLHTLIIDMSAEFHVSSGEKPFHQVINEFRARGFAVDWPSPFSNKLKFTW